MLPTLIYMYIMLIYVLPTLIYVFAMLIYVLTIRYTLRVYYA